MSQDTASAALEVRRETAAVPLPPMDDRELASLYRTARALAESGLFKDATQAQQAFAKVLVGRDLGLTPFEAMSSLHVIEGKVEASSDLHATRVRERAGYDFRVAWIKVPKMPELGTDYDPTALGAEAVWADEEDLADLRPVFGCAIAFYTDLLPEQDVRDDDVRPRGVSRFTLGDAVYAGLIKDRSGWAKFPRNMLYARAMTNGVAWYVSEVMGGVRVYGPGELPRDTGEDLTAGDPRTTSTAQAAKSLPTEVEAVIARAAELGHAGLANREAAAMAIGGQSPEFVRTWVRNATGELNRMSAGKLAPAPEPEPADAEVVPQKPVDAKAAEAFEQPDGAVAAEARAAMQARLEELEDRIARAGEDPDITSDDTADLAAEADGLRAQLGALGDPAQTDLGV